MSIEARADVKTLAQLEQRMGELGHGDFAQDTTGSFQHFPRLTCTACAAEGVVVIGSHAYGTGIERECRLAPIPAPVSALALADNPFLAGVELPVKTGSHDEAVPPGPGSAWIG